MIIERDNLLQQHLVRQLEIQSWRLFYAMQPKDIKRMFKRHGIDVVLLSLNDLKKEGLALIKMIKKMRPPIQIITVNSPDQISLSIEGMKLGAFDDFLMPLDLDSLILRIRDAWQAKKHIEIVKPSLLQRCQDLMVAASFAEAGDTETARELLLKVPKDASKKAEQKKGD